MYKGVHVFPLSLGVTMLIGSVASKEVLVVLLFLSSKFTCYLAVK